MKRKYPLFDSFDTPRANRMEVDHRAEQSGTSSAAPNQHVRVQRAVARALPTVAGWISVFVLVTLLVVALAARGETDSGDASRDTAGTSIRDESVARAPGVNLQSGADEFDLAGESDQRFERSGGSQY